MSPRIGWKTAPFTQFLFASADMSLASREEDRLRFRSPFDGGSDVACCAPLGSALESSPGAPRFDLEVLEGRTLLSGTGASPRREGVLHDGADSLLANRRDRGKRGLHRDRGGRRRRFADPFGQDHLRGRGSPEDRPGHRQGQRVGPGQRLDGQAHQDRDVSGQGRVHARHSPGFRERVGAPGREGDPPAAPCTHRRQS